MTLVLVSAVVLAIAASSAVWGAYMRLARWRVALAALGAVGGVALLTVELLCWL
jgi:hypothetical protein